MTFTTHQGNSTGPTKSSKKISMQLCPATSQSAFHNNTDSYMLTCHAQPQTHFTHHQPLMPKLQYVHFSQLGTQLE